MDTTILVLSDTHSGHPLALFPDRQMELKNTNHTPNAFQRLLYKHMVEVCDYVKAERYRGLLKSKRRLVVVMLGDAIEGVHHSNKDIISQYLNQQMRVHTELMDDILTRVEYNADKGDLLYYVDGTPSHAGEKEYEIASDLGAVPYNEGQPTWPILKLKLNNKRIWFSHHGASAGSSESSYGNNLRGKLRDLYTQQAFEKEPAPDVMVFGDKHKPTMEIYSRNGVELMRGFTCPSWKLKDDYVYHVAPLSINRIGSLVLSVDERGNVTHNMMTIKIEQIGEQAI